MQQEGEQEEAVSGKAKLGDEASLCGLCEGDLQWHTTSPLSFCFLVDSGNLHDRRQDPETLSLLSSPLDLSPGSELALLDAL